ncbi:MAG: ExeM/NucH family extracellular endonuclease [Thiohalospira sp.]
MERRIPRLTAALLLALAPLGAFAAPCDERGRPVSAITGADGDESLPAGETVTLRGRVAGAFLEGLDGFWLQQGEGRSARGVFVYAPQLEPDSGEGEAVRAGRRLAVTAETDRYRGRVQLNRVEAIADCGPGTLEPTTIRWPLPPEERQRRAGTRVTLQHEMVVSGHFQLGRYGSLHLAPERVFHPNHLPTGPAEPDWLVLDDGEYRRGPDPVPYLDDHGTRRAGSRVTELTGILTRAFGQWRLHPTEQPTFRRGERPPPPRAPASGRRRVAALNLANLFETLGERGAETAAQRRRQSGRLAALVDRLEADVVAVGELENRGAAVDRLTESVGRDDYRARRRAPVGEDAIRNALLYRPDRVRPEGPLRILEEEPFARPPLVQRFRPLGTDGGAFTVVAVHLKSKGGCPDDGDVDRGAGCWDGQRTRAAEALSRVLADEPGPVIIAGDLNAYPAERPVARLRRAGYADLLHRHQPAEASHTYNYRGRSGRLDYLLVRDGERVREAGIWGVNADEPAIAAEAGPWRAGDHDPVWLDLGLEAR